jgi:hypothetical protein
MDRPPKESDLAQAGAFTFTIWVRDGAGDTARQTFSIAIGGFLQEIDGVRRPLK